MCSQRDAEYLCSKANEKQRKNSKIILVVYRLLKSVGIIVDLSIFILFLCKQSILWVCMLSSSGGIISSTRT